MTLEIIEHYTFFIRIAIDVFEVSRYISLYRKKMLQASPFQGEEGSKHTRKCIEFLQRQQN